MKVLGFIAGIVLVTLGSALFVRAVMPDLWLQLSEELPKRLTGVMQADPAPTGRQAEPPVESPLLGPPGFVTLPPATVPGPGATDRTGGQAQEPDAEKFAQRPRAAAGEALDAVVPAGPEAPSDDTAGARNLPVASGTAAGRASGEASSDAEAESPGNASPAFSGAGPFAGGESQPPDATTPPIAWHAFWRPFRTESSATGFASHIRQATGLPIEVRRAPRGGYAVGIAYGDEMELERNIALIEARTGLRVLAQAHR